MPAQTVIRLRRGTAAQWASVNPILAAGEVGIETDTQKFKFGNGTSQWNTRPYAVAANDPTGVTVLWENVQNKPDTFAPSAHTHTKSQITDFAHTHTKSEITDFAHTHTISEITNYDKTAGTVLSDTAPATPVDGLRWIKTTTMQEYVRYNSLWVEV
jgi:hypothetical protein